MRLAETKGVKDCHSVPGKSAEKGCLQYQEPTWRSHSKIILGYIAPRTEINERYVATQMVQRWLNRGYSAYQIALIWNGGEAVEKSGVNSYGEPYNTKAHAEKVIYYLNR